MRGRWKGWNEEKVERMKELKGQYHEIFWSGVFLGNQVPLGPDYNLKTDSLFCEFSKLLANSVSLSSYKTGRVINFRVSLRGK